MAVEFASNLRLQSALPNFERDQFQNLAAAKAYDTNFLDEGHLAYCIDEGKTYRWTAAGGWQEFEPGSGGTSVTVDDELSNSSGNPVEGKAIYKALYGFSDAEAVGVQNIPKMYTLPSARSLSTAYTLATDPTAASSISMNDYAVVKDQNGDIAIGYSTDGSKFYYSDLNFMSNLHIGDLIYSSGVLYMVKQLAGHTGSDLSVGWNHLLLSKVVLEDTYAAWE